MLRRTLLLSITLSSALLTACSSDDSGTAPEDSGADVIESDGPITTRPDDGVDTDVPDTGADDAADTGDTEDATEDASADTTTEDATDDASTDATEDSATEDTAVEDSATEDTAVEDSATEDTAVEDSATEDTAVEDSATEDTAVEDSATEDATTDTAVEDASDAGEDAATDAGEDAAADAEPGPLPAEPGSARLHEIGLDRALEGDKVEFIEISAPEGTPLDGLKLRILREDGSVRSVLAVADKGATMPSQGLWLVGCSCSLTYSGDKAYPLSQWGLENDKGAIQLIRTDRGSDELVDVVAYGITPKEPDTDPKKVVEGSPVTSLGAKGQSIGRASVPGDTNDNASDFCVMTASPGKANGACLK